MDLPPKDLAVIFLLAAVAGVLAGTVTARRSFTRQPCRLLGHRYHHVNRTTWGCAICGTHIPAPMV